MSRLDKKVFFSSKSGEVAISWVEHKETDTKAILTTHVMRQLFALLATSSQPPEKRVADILAAILESDVDQELFDFTNSSAICEMIERYRTEICQFRLEEARWVERRKNVEEISYVHDLHVFDRLQRGFHSYVKNWHEWGEFLTMSWQDEKYEYMHCDRTDLKALIYRFAKDASRHKLAIQPVVDGDDLWERMKKLMQQEWHGLPVTKQFYIKLLLFADWHLSLYVEPTDTLGIGGEEDHTSPRMFRLFSKKRHIFNLIRAHGRYRRPGSIDEAFELPFDLWLDQDIELTPHR